MWSPAAASVTLSAPGKANVSHSPLRWAITEVKSSEHKVFLLVKTALNFSVTEAKKDRREFLQCCLLLE